MKPTHIEHIGIAVKSLKESIPYYENILGLKCYSIEEVADQKVRTAFFMVGQTKLELLEPMSEDSTIAAFIEKRGEGIHHMAFAVKELPDVFIRAQGLSDIRINEVLVYNENTCIDNYGEHSGWFEIYNLGNRTINIGGWYCHCMFGIALFSCTA